MPSTQSITRIESGKLDCVFMEIEDDDPLTAEELANIESGEDDIHHGRMISIEEYERQRGL